MLKGKALYNSLVGLSNDLSLSRKVETVEAKTLAEEFNCPFIETSARHNANVSKVFELLIAEIEKHNNPTPDANNKCAIA